MDAPEGVDDGEVGSELSGERCRAVSADVEAAALFGSVVRERGHHEVAAAAHCVGSSAHVLGSVVGVDEEMKRRSVVPHVDRFGQRELAYVGMVELHDLAAGSERRSESFECGLGDVDGVKATVSGGEEFSDDGGRARADDGDGVDGRRHATQQRRSGFSGRLVPAEVLISPRRPHLIPVLAHYVVDRFGHPRDRRGARGAPLTFEK